MLVFDILCENTFNCFMHLPQTLRWSLAVSKFINKLLVTMWEIHDHIKNNYETVVRIFNNNSLLLLNSYHILQVETKVNYSLTLPTYKLSWARKQESGQTHSPWHHPTLLNCILQCKLSTKFGTLPSHFTNSYLLIPLLLSLTSLKIPFLLLT